MSGTTSAVLDFFFGNIVGAHSIDSSSSQSPTNSPETSSSSPFGGGEDDEMRGGESSTVGSSGKSSSREMYRPGEDASSSFRRRGGQWDDDERRIAERGRRVVGVRGGTVRREWECTWERRRRRRRRVEVANGDEKRWRREKRVRAVDAEEQQQNEFGEPSNGELNERDFRTGALGLPYCFKLTGVFLTTTLIVVSACATIYTTQCLLFASAVTDAWSSRGSRV